MGATFFVCDPACAGLLEALVDQMEAEEVLDETLEDSAYDRFSSTLKAHQREAIALDDAASEPAEAFYLWFHERVSPDLDKLYLLPEEAVRALEALKKLRARQGDDKLVRGFWQEGQDFSPAAALEYLNQFQRALERAVALAALLAVAYDP